MLQLSVKKYKVGISTYLSLDEKSSVDAASEIEGTPGLNTDTATILA